MLQRCFFAEYERMSKEILKYRKELPPLKLVAQFEESLDDLRQHLYRNKVKMPIPKYLYDEEDETTHAYIRDIDLPMPVPNPNYRFKDVWERIDGLKGVR